MIRSSVIIPSFQSESTIVPCLEAILAQEDAGPFEVIVAHSGPSGATDVIRRRFPRVQLLTSAPRLDPAAARNWGASHARGSIFAFVDADCVVERDWLRRLCSGIDNNAYDGVGGAIRNVDGSNSTGWAGYFCEFREFLPRGEHGEATNLTLGNVAYRAKAFKRAGGFPEGYFPQEDQVFHERLLAIGGRIHFDPSIVVRHTHRDTVRAFLAHQAAIGTANARVVRTLGLSGAAIASRRWLAAALLPALVSYRFARTFAACWSHEDYLLLRRPSVAGLCCLGMVAWGVGFTRSR